MAISVNPLTYVISVPQSFLTFISGVLYELDVNALRLALKDWEDENFGLAMPDTHVHATQVVLSGVTYARAFSIKPPYTVEFEDGQYTVRCVGANHNLADVKVPNQVSLVVGNAAGLISVTQGSGVTEQDKVDIMNKVWDDKPLEGALSPKHLMRLMAAVLLGKSSGGATPNIVFRDTDDSKNRVTATVTDKGSRTSVNLDPN